MAYTSYGLHSMAMYVVMAPARAGQTTRRRAGTCTGGVAGSRKVLVMSVLRYVPFGGTAVQFPPRSVSAILAAVLLRLRLPRHLPISYFHHEESPDLEGGHEEAQHGASRPCKHQGPNVDIMYPRQVIARRPPYPPISHLMISENCIFIGHKPHRASLS